MEVRKTMPMMYNYPFYYSLGNGIFGIWGWVFRLIFWVLVIWLILSLIRHNRHERIHDKLHPEDENLSNLDIIKRRLAKGEITKKEYQEMKKELEI
jgi:putative membrane protein